MKVIKIITHEGGWRLKFSIVVSEDYYWLILHKVNEIQSFKTWSFKKSTAEWHMSEAEDLVEKIIELSESVGNKADFVNRLFHTLDFKSWEYWGGGIPEPLSDYYSSGEFERQCKEFEKIYSYVGPAEILANVSIDTPGKSILSNNDVLEWIEEASQVLDEVNTVTATYVINKKGTLLIADRHSEHVACAGGEPVLSAGEITFEVISNQAEVVFLSNQSTGYCPEPSSWKSVEAALKKANIKTPPFFTAEFEFRRCGVCDSINIIKDRNYYCSVCDSPLSKEWNF